LIRYVNLIWFAINKKAPQMLGQGGHRRNREGGEKMVTMINAAISDSLKK